MEVDTCRTFPEVGFRQEKHFCQGENNNRVSFFCFVLSVVIVCEVNVEYSLTVITLE